MAPLTIASTLAFSLIGRAIMLGNMWYIAVTLDGRPATVGSMIFISAMRICQCIVGGVAHEHSDYAAETTSCSVLDRAYCMQIPQASLTTYITQTELDTIQLTYAQCMNTMTVAQISVTKTSITQAN